MSEEINYIDEKHGDNQLNVAFEKKVTEEGKEVDYIRISIPGNSFTIIEEPVSEDHKARFRRKWEEYTNMRKATGTPMEDWEGCPEAMIRELKKHDFNFIEQLANAPESSLGALMGGLGWREKARRYLESKRVTPDMLISAQQAQIEELQHLVQELLANQPAKRGRPALTE